MSKPVIAAFDFDNTLTKKDTLVPFLCDAAGKPKTYLTLFKMIPYFIGFLLGIVSRQTIKEQLLTRLLTKIPIAQLKKISEKFVQEKIPELLNPEALARLQWHKKQGHQIALVSAAIDLYLDPWARQMQFDIVVTSHCEINSDGYITGRLKGLNCWGPEKVKRFLETAAPRDHYILYAYGDSKGDEELLALADYPFYRNFGET